MLRRTLLGLLALVSASPARAAGPAPAAGGKSEVSLVRLPVLNANIIRSNRTRGVISVESALDVPDPKLRARVQLMIPRLRSDLTRRLGLFTSNLGAGAPPDLDLLAPQLQKQVDATVGQPGARLLMQNVLIN